MILLVWFACAFEANIISFVLLVVIARHCYRRFFDAENYNYIKWTIGTLILIMYILAVLSLSSYNSPLPLPINITRDNSTQTSVSYLAEPVEFPSKSVEVYPNSAHYYLDIPVYFAAANATDPSAYDPTTG